MLQEPDYFAQLTTLAAAYFGQPTTVKVVPVTASAVDVPLSLAEKKSLDDARQERELKAAVSGDPLVKAALEIFGGEIEQYKKE
jgi:hypothetical protein